MEVPLKVDSWGDKTPAFLFARNAPVVTFCIDGNMAVGVVTAVVRIIVHAVSGQVAVVVVVETDAVDCAVLVQPVRRIRGGRGRRLRQILEPIIADLAFEAVADHIVTVIECDRAAAAKDVLQRFQIIINLVTVTGGRPIAVTQ